MKRLVGILLKTVLPLALGVYLVWYFFDRMTPADKGFFYKAIHEANYFWIVLSLLLSFLSLLSRAYRWKYVLEPLGYETKFWNRYHALMIGYIVNLTIPRAGEASRAVMLYRSDGVPFSKSFGTILAERAVDLVMLLIVVLITIWIGHDDFWNIKYRVEHSFGGDGKTGETSWVTYAFYVLFALLFIALVAFSMIKRLRDKLILFIKDVFAGVFSILRSRNPFSYIGHTLFIWVMYVSYFSITFLSLEEAGNVPFTGIMIAFVAGSLGISFTNGGIGAFPLLVGLVLNFYLSDEYGAAATGIGCALGMIIWSSQTLMMILLGALSFVLLPKNYSAKDEQAR
jgi:glycosyltransferase 2 family protein